MGNGSVWRILSMALRPDYWMAIPHVGRNPVEMKTAAGGLHTGDVLLGVANMERKGRGWTGHYETREIRRLDSIKASGWDSGHPRFQWMPASLKSPVSNANASRADFSILPILFSEKWQHSDMTFP